MTAFDSHTSFWSLYLWPVVVGMALTLTSPWTRLAFDWTSSKPLARSRLMTIQDQHNDQQAKLELEKVVIERNKNKELELIRQAKMSQKIESSNLSDKEKKELNNNIDHVREGSINEKSLNKYEFFNSISKYSLQSFDIKVVNLLLDGPITVHYKAGYLRAVTLGIVKIEAETDSIPLQEFNFDDITDSLIALTDAKIVSYTEIAIDIKQYQLTVNGMKFTNFMDSLEESDLEELDLILDSNEEGYVPT